MEQAGGRTREAHSPRRPGAASPVAHAQRGTLLWEYRPPRAHPILYAGLLVTTAVFLLGSLENLVRDRRADLEVVYAMPILAVALIMALLWPNNVRLYEGGVAPSRVLVLRWWRPFIPWKDVTAAFPASYDVTGAFVSPFASSDGKVTQTGLGLELQGGGRETLRFTPTRFSLTARRSRGYREALDVVRDVFARMQRPLVPTGETLDPQQRETLLAQARAPFLPFFAIVFLFASAAPILWLLLRIPGMPIGVALPIALLAPLGTSLQSWRKSRQRNRILDRLSKAAEYERSRTPSAPRTPPPPAAEVRA